MRGATTVKEAQDKLNMWIVLSSYIKHCMATVLRENPFSPSELATSIHRYMEFHPECGRSSVSVWNSYHTLVEPSPTTKAISTEILLELFQQNTHIDRFFKTTVTK